MSLLNFLPTFFGCSPAWLFSFTLFIATIWSTVGGGENGLWVGDEMMANALAWEGERGDGRFSPRSSNGFEEGFARGVVFIGRIEVVALVS